MIDRDAFITQYLAELNENIQTVDYSVILLKKEGENEEELNKILRSLHTIKGSSRMLKFQTVEKLTHGLENVFKGIKEKRYGIDDLLAQMVFLSTKTMRLLMDNIQHLKTDEMEVDAFVSACEKIYSSEAFQLETLHAEWKKLFASQREKREEDTMIHLEQTQLMEKVDLPVSNEGNPEKIAEFQTIRVQLERIDEIITSMNKLIIRQFQFKKEYERITHLERRLLEKIQNQQSVQTHKGSKEDHESLKDIQSIKKSFFEQVQLLERDTFELQRQIISLRMFPLQTILGSLPAMVEENAIKLGKKIDFKMTGTDVKLDKVILEKIYDPVIHLIRNCLDHGIESPQERERKGKEIAGKIAVSCRSERSSITLEIEDDGKGIEFERVKEKALRLYPGLGGKVNEMVEHELLSFLFMPGFTTRDSVSDMSGRGVGLDIVKHNIEKIKGKITVHSEKDKGTVFSLVLPLSLATLKGYFVDVSGNKFFIPSNFIKEIVSLEPEEKLKILNRESFRLRNAIIPLYSLSNMLNLQEEAIDRRIFVVVVESMGEVMGIVVDSILEYACLIYKSLPRNLRELKEIQGIVFDENYNMVNILYVPALMERFKVLGDLEFKKQIEKESKKQSCVLVVDDSFNTREIEKNILESSGYRTVTAKDGIDGLEKLKEEDISVILTDLIMPRMDGFTFIENLRRNDSYKSIPVVVISNHDDEEAKMKALSVGANAFIVKSEFDRNHLVKIIQSLI